MASQAQVLPFYVIIDESFSMTDHMDDLNSSLVDFHKVIAQDPVVCDKALFSVITFSDTAEVLVPLTRADVLSTMPGCQPKGSTSYGAAFKKLRSTIDTDVAKLKSAGTPILRPVVYFITDGEPTDDSVWELEHQAVTADTNPYRPHILSFGVANADADVILKVATVVSRFGRKFAYLANEGADAGAALKEIIGKLASTIVASTRSGDGASGGVELIPPQNIEGVRDLGRIALDEI